MNRLYINVLQSAFNNCFKNVTSGSILSAAEVTPVLKMVIRINKNNYGSISILSKIPKVFEKWMYQKISGYFLIDTDKVETAQHWFFLLKNKKLFQIKENQQTKFLQLWWITIIGNTKHFKNIQDLKTKN